MAGRALTSCLLAALVAVPAFGDTPAGAGVKAVERMFLERTAISASDKSCNLFTEGERLALKSGLYQSEGELLRANKDPEEINRLAAEVRTHAKALGCDHPSVLDVAGTIRSSYRQFSKTNALEFPAANSTWETSRSPHDAWGVKQTDKKSGFIFGLRRENREKPEAFTLAIAMPYDDKPPSVVQLYLRDAAKMSDPWLGAIFGGGAQLTPAPRSVSRPEFAGRLEEWEDNVKDWYNIYYFSPAAIARLELLDPREAVTIELTPNRLAKDKTPVKVVFEIGDFRAARAFAMIPAPPMSLLAAGAAPAEKSGGGGH